MSEQKKYFVQNELNHYNQIYILNGSINLDNEQLISIISCLLEEILQITDQQENKFPSIFHNKKLPTISIRDYLLRINRICHCSQECFILSIIYIDKIIQRQKEFVVNSFCIHRLLLASIMVAAKFFDDKYYNNSYYAKAGGVSSVEINYYERSFLQLINFNLFVKEYQFYNYRQKLLDSYQQQLQGSESQI
ncbi:n-terminal domain protein [Ichthyophthirius multifiliis]|uniref:Cyclin n=1 Tax=Ichthyophthirius multifiliis TaxID=5932 RepID=G0QRC1_ICHMU|nr:n-terminal domain protein [Ichthyophthirius multifiliis]EGR32235.1 n-terminal domain protein [Ichthyophthirius multifiliis]|eukprot:XP_004035721.1 n-terminal domain protein [Ichthyophthirius multifiliis]